MYKLLIACGNPSAAQSVAAVLKGKYITQTCSSGYDLIGLLDSFQPEVLLLQFELLDITGLSALAQASHRPAAILGLTAYLDPEIEQQAVDLGVQSIWMLPCIPPRMLKHLDRLVATVLPAQD